MPFFGRRSTTGSDKRGSVLQNSEEFTKIREMLRNDKDLKGELSRKDVFHDEYLDRFIKARKFVFADVKQMVKDHLAFRKEYDIENIADFKFPELEQVKALYPHGYHGTDKQGRSIYFERLGHLDVNALLEATTFERLLKYYVREYEYLYKVRMPSCSREVGRPVNKTITILDLKGVGMRQVSTKVKHMLGTISKIAGDNYPETLGAMYIVNTPSVFTAIWSMVKGLIDPETRKKIHILGYNYKATLYEVIDKDQLPTFLEGTCDCAKTRGIAGGCLSSNKGPWEKHEAELLGKVKEKEQPIVLGAVEQDRVAPASGGIATVAGGTATIAVDELTPDEPVEAAPPMEPVLQSAKEDDEFVDISEVELANGASGNGMDEKPPKVPQIEETQVRSSCGGFFGIFKMCFSAKN